jgi:hypothetical protein
MKGVLLRPRGVRGSLDSSREAVIIAGLDGSFPSTADALPPPAALEGYDTTGTGETQRFSHIAKWAEEMAHRGKIVAISALDGNHDPEPCTNILDSICPITGLATPFAAVSRGAVFRSHDGTDDYSRILIY